MQPATLALHDLFCYPNNGAGRVRRPALSFSAAGTLRLIGQVRLLLMLRKHTSITVKIALSLHPNDDSSIIRALGHGEQGQRAVIAREFFSAFARTVSDPNQLTLERKSYQRHSSQVLPVSLTFDREHHAREIALLLYFPDDRTALLRTALRWAVTQPKSIAEPSGLLSPLSAQGPLPDDFYKPYRFKTVEGDTIETFAADGHTLRAVYRTDQSLVLTTSRTRLYRALGFRMTRKKHVIITLDTQEEIPVSERDLVFLRSAYNALAQAYGLESIQG